MRAGLCGIGEEAGALHGDIDAEFGMRQLGRVALGRDTDTMTIDNDVITIDRHDAMKRTMHRIPLQQPGVGGGIAKVVDRDNDDIAALDFKNGAQNVASDATETVDGDLDGHDLLPFA